MICMLYSLHFKCMQSDTVLKKCLPIKFYTDILFAYAMMSITLFLAFKYTLWYLQHGLHHLMNKTVNLINIVLLIICLRNVNFISKCLNENSRAA